jgi:hypothetical protein
MVGPPEVCALQLRYGYDLENVALTVAVWQAMRGSRTAAHHAISVYVHFEAIMNGFRARHAAVFADVHGHRLKRRSATVLYL